MKIALIVNPHSGNKKGEKLLPIVEKKLLLNHIDYHTYISLYHEHILKITSELKLDQYDAIIAMGGDGTNFYVLNGLISTFKPKKNSSPKTKKRDSHHRVFRQDLLLDHIKRPAGIRRIHPTAKIPDVIDHIRP